MISMTSKLDWHTSLLVGLFLLLLVAVLLWGDTTVERRFDPDSREPSGLFLLQEWLQEMGYHVTTTGQRRFALSPRQHLLLIYPGDERFTSSEADSFFEWVEAGGTAVIIGEADTKLRRALNYSALTSFTVGIVDQSQPLLPDASEPFDRGGRRFDLTEAPQTIAVLDGNQGPKLAVLGRGDGWVWLVGEPLAFTNGQLSEDHAQAQLIPAFLRTVPAGGTVVLDSYHLFGPLLPVGAAPVESLKDWLYFTTTGWAVVFLLLLCGGWLLLSGWRLGPPLEVLTQGRRREAAEFVVAMAGLQRRARIRDHIARQQRYRLKQFLGKPWRIRPSLSDDEFLRQLQAMDPTLGVTARQGVPMRNYPPPDSGAELSIDEIEQMLDELATVPDEERLLQLAQRIDRVRASAGDRILA
jgi:hypothetical protein